MSTTTSNSDKSSKILRQIEYYFSDLNLLRDSFMRRQVSQDDGWVEIGTLLSFKRLAAIAKDNQDVVDAITNSSQLELDEEKKRIRRILNKPLPENREEFNKETIVRSVYIKGFPKETTMNELVDFMEQFNSSVHIHRRNYCDQLTKTWVFKGSVFVTFQSTEEAEKFLSTPSVKYNDTELIKMSKQDYIDSKRKKRLEFKEARKDKKLELLGKKVETSLPKGALLRLSEIPNDIDVKDFRFLLKKKYNAAFISHESKDTTAVVRLREENAAKKLLEGGNKLTLNDDLTVTAELIENEEETELLEKMLREMKEVALKSNNKQKKKNKFDKPKYTDIKSRRGGRSPTTNKDALDANGSYDKVGDTEEGKVLDSGEESDVVSKRKVDEESNAEEGASKKLKTSDDA